MKKKFPIDNLSWSKISLFERSKKQFIERYFDGKDLYKSSEMNFGKYIAETLEKGLPIEGVPKLDDVEKKLECNVQGIPCIGYMDSSKKDLSEFFEYKTGKVDWHQNLVDNHNQLLMYATMIYDITGNIPTCKLYWIETEDTPYGIHMTGRVREFSRSFTVKEIDIFKTYITRIWKEMYELWVRKTDGIVDIKPLNKYAKNKAKIADLERENEELLLGIQEQLVNRPEGLTTTYGAFSWCSRKKYTYTEDLLKLDRDLKEKKKIQEAEGIATVEEKKYLMFKSIQS